MYVAVIDFTGESLYLMGKKQTNKKNILSD